MGSHWTDIDQSRGFFKDRVAQHAPIIDGNIWYGFQQDFSQLPAVSFQNNNQQSPADFGSRPLIIFRHFIKTRNTQPATCNLQPATRIV
jgi:hypothetical protein